MGYHFIKIGNSHPSVGDKVKIEVDFFLGRFFIEVRNIYFIYDLCIVDCIFSFNELFRFRSFISRRSRDR